MKYSIYDLNTSLEALVLHYKGVTDKDGNLLINREAALNCIEVINWFKSLYARAKSYIGNWAARIKLVWAELTETVKEIVIKTVESANIIVRKPHRFTLNWVENFGITAKYRQSRIVKNGYKLRKQRTDNVHSSRLQRSLNY